MAYIGLRGKGYGLALIDFSDPANAWVVATYATFTPAYNDSRNLFLSDGYLYSANGDVGISVLSVNP